MLSSPSPCLLQAVQAEGAHCVVIDPALIETEHGEVHYCEPLLTLLATEPHPPVQALILLVLFKDQAACLPDWLTSLAAEIQPLSTPCSWRLTLANALPLTLLLCERVGANPLPAIEALVASVIEASPAVVLIDGEGMPQNGCYSRPLRWCRNLMERSDIALVLLTCAADFGKIINARKRARAYLCLYVHADTTGKYLWETRYNGYIAGDQLSPDQLQNLQSALLRINQAEMLISEQALALNHKLRQQQACGNAWFTSYHLSVDVKFLLRSDDPRWSEGSNNYGGFNE